MLARDEFLDAVGQGFPIVFGEIEAAQVDDLALTGPDGGSDGLHQAMGDEGLIVTRVFLDDFLDEHSG